MTIFEFTEQLCDIIGGEDAYYRFEKDELLKMCQEMSNSHEELTNIKECKDAKEAHELFYQSERIGSLWLTSTQMSQQSAH